jgi:hypothetical protein
MRPIEFDVFLLVSFAVGFANAISHGRYLGAALACLAVALVLLGWSFVERLKPQTSILRPSPPGSGWVLWVMLASMPVTALLDPKVILYPRGSLAPLRWLEAASLALLVTYLPFMARPSEAGTIRGGPGSLRVKPAVLRRARFAAFLALTLATGIAVIKLSPAPDIDVWPMQMRAAEALLEGKNPYSTVLVPTPSGALYSTPGHVVSAVPFVYGPGTFFAGALGLLVGRDVRWTMLLAVLATGLALRAIARPTTSPRALRCSWVEDAPALFVWLTPLLAQVVEQSWTDPVQLMLVTVGCAAFASGWPLGASIAIGLSLATKQTMLWILPIAGFAFAFGLREWAAMTATAVLPMAAYALKDYPAFKNAAIFYQVHLPPRPDALCAALWVKRTLGVTVPTAIATACAAIAAGLAIGQSLRLDSRWREHGIVPAGRASGPAQATPMLTSERAALFARAAALTYFVFFFFNKWAFANYYFFVTGAAALAAAASLRAFRVSAGAEKVE